MKCDDPIYDMTVISLSHEDQILILRKHFEDKGYRVHSGLQFGCELVLYADAPDLVHSDFCVKLIPPHWEDGLDWRCLQTLCRSMPDLHKTLIVCRVTRKCVERVKIEDSVEEIAVTSEHAPFRYREKKIDIGCQVKRQKYE